MSSELLPLSFRLQINQRGRKKSLLSDPFRPAKGLGAGQVPGGPLRKRAPYWADDLQDENPA